MIAVLLLLFSNRCVCFERACVKGFFLMEFSFFFAKAVTYM